MAKITDRCYEATGHTAFICDFSPPRSGQLSALAQADLDADFIAVAYNPGRAVRVNSAMLAAAIKLHLGRDVVFIVATRDMNKLGLQSMLLGAQLLGLENVVVVQGDPFNRRDRTFVRDASDVSPTGLLAAIGDMNRGIDFRGSQLLSPTGFAIGATLDLGRGIDAEAALAHRKIEAGAQFLITQPIFQAAEAIRFNNAYLAVAGRALNVPVFYGLQVLEMGGVVFSSVPDEVREELARGRTGPEIALELFQEFQKNGLHNVYLVPPIRHGGARDYEAAGRVLADAKRI